MSLKRRHKINPNFSMSSLTDIIFLLLIFFMLTSTLVTTNALNLVLPSANGKTISPKTISVSITTGGKYFVDRNTVTYEQLPEVITQKLSEEEDPTIVLNAEVGVPIEEVVKVMNIANDLNAKMILATQPLK